MSDYAASLPQTSQFRGLLVKMAEVMLIIIVGLGTLAGFIAGVSVFAHGFFAGIFCTIIFTALGFILSGLSMAVLAILLDIRQALISRR